MKALRWYARSDLRYDEVPEPTVGPGEVKARINLAGICGSELKEYAHGPVMLPIEKAPIIIGHEFAGKVVEVGAGVTDFQVGDRVSGLGYRKCDECHYCKKGIYNLCLNGGFTGMNTQGCMAEYLVAPDYSYYKLPNSVSDEEGALVEPLSVAMHAVRRGKVQAGDRVAIVGDGAIGLSALASARASGATEVYLVSKHKNRGKVAAAMGATAVINLSDGDPVKRVSSLTGGLGVDVAIECVGKMDAARLTVDLAGRGGTIVLVGVFEKPEEFNLASLGFPEKTIVGSSIYIDEARTVIALLADKRIDARRLVTSIVPLKDAVKLGFDKQLASKEDNIKILLRIP
jgi:(R,R)-butanediol dehydrogenase / meso-butanediol dehydrogenase / diacetyl reductase